MKHLKRIAYVAMFFGLVGGFIYGLYWLNPLIFYFYLACLFLMYARYGIGVKTDLTRWAVQVLTSIDQHWAVLLKFPLNMAPDMVHGFGNPDETASSVVGKNLKATGAWHWKAIEFCLAYLLEGGKAHSIPAIEEDERSGK